MTGVVTGDDCNDSVVTAGNDSVVTRLVQMRWPEELVVTVACAAGERGRTAFVIEAVKEKLARESGGRSDVVMTGDRLAKIEQMVQELLKRDDAATMKSEVAVTAPPGVVKSSRSKKPKPQPTAGDGAAGDDGAGEPVNSDVVADVVIPRSRWHKDGACPKTGQWWRMDESGPEPVCTQCGASVTEAQYDSALVVRAEVEPSPF